MKKLCAMLLSASLLNSSPATPAEDNPVIPASVPNDFDIGAILGSLLGDPPGAEPVTRKAAIYGHYEREENDATALLEKQQIVQQLNDSISIPVYFRTNDTTLSQDAEAQIRQLAVLIRGYPEIRVRLDAYADERGLPSYNLQLSKARALIVQKKLAQAGLPASRIVLYAHGEELAWEGCGDGPDVYEYDRRVDISFTRATDISI